ncbi:MAG: TetR/AcrR family transcriptional regulator, partial [Eubacteriales bacterium]
AYKCYEPADLFEMMERGMRAKLRIMKQYPHMAAFVVKAFYEKDTEISREIQSSYRKYFDKKAANALESLNPDDFVPGLDLQMMYREMYWASEGYLWEMLRQGGLDADRMEKDFERLLGFWKSVYKRKEKQDESDHND